MDDPRRARPEGNHAPGRHSGPLLRPPEQRGPTGKVPKRAVRCRIRGGRRCRHPGIQGPGRPCLPVRHDGREDDIVRPAQGARQGGRRGRIYFNVEAAARGHQGDPGACQHRDSQAQGRR